MVSYGSDGDTQVKVRQLLREVASLKESMRLLERNRSARWSPPGLNLVPAILNEYLAAQTSASASFMAIGPGPVLTPDEAFTVYDWMMNPGDSIAAGSRIWVCEWEGYWWVVVPYCEVDSASPSPVPVVNPPPPPNPIPPWEDPESVMPGIVALIHNASGGFTGGMTSDIDEFP